MCWFVLFRCFWVLEDLQDHQTHSKSILFEHTSLCFWSPLLDEDLSDLSASLVEQQEAPGSFQRGKRLSLRLPDWSSRNPGEVSMRKVAELEGQVRSV